MRWSYIDVTTTDPAFNLALEQYVFDALPRHRNYFLLWQNDNAVIVGRHQNTLAEINETYVRENGIQVVRRLSGGGAVYHDLGNLNFTFIQDAASGIHLDLGLFCRPMAQAIRSLGAQAVVNGRNDITVNGKKFSGNAQYMRDGRVMHHGTILFDSDLTAASLALCPDPEKVHAKGVKSVRSRMTTLREQIPGRISLAEFKTRLLEELFAGQPMEPYTLTADDFGEIESLRRERYSTWEWNYGGSPPCDLIRKGRVEGCGSVEARFRIQNGRIRDAAFRGDFFSAREPQALAGRFAGLRPIAEDYRKALDGVDVSEYFTGLGKEELLAILEKA